jgi:tricarballylate dehydrogenase
MSPYTNLQERLWDVIVVGGGNAGLCAAIEAAKQHKKVLLLECAPKPYRGGNSRHTRNFRCMHTQPVSKLTGVYLEDEYLQDLLKVTDNNTNLTLARKTISESEACLSWMEQHGVRFQPSLSGTLSLSRTNAFFLGGGKALVNAYYNTIEELGVTIAYNASVNRVNIQAHRFDNLSATIDGKELSLTGTSVVLASGGFQADKSWLADAWGPAANNFLIRGTPYNRGIVLKSMLNNNAQTVGDPTQCHAVAIDGRAPEYDGGIVTRLDCVPFSVVVNQLGTRFYDEGEDLWPKRYAIWGRLVAAQPNQVAYAIIDDDTVPFFLPSVYPPVTAQTIPALAQALHLPVKQTVETIETFNRSCREGTFHPTELDGLATEGLSPPKSNWARPLTKAPFHGYPLKPGVTFTYLGLKIDENARVQGPTAPYDNIWAAGEIMAGSILGQGYLAGFGMTIGTVFGRIAGREAAAHA